MNSPPAEISESNGYTYGPDFLKLACELDISEYELEIALEDAVRLTQQTSPRDRPANKKALRGVSKLLERAIERLSNPGIRERLALANYEKPKELDADGHAKYFAIAHAQHRVDQAIESTRNLLEFVNRGEELNLRSGRPAYDPCNAAFLSLLCFWTEELGRKVTISGHASDGREVNPSATVRFMYGSMRLIGQEMSEQKCRRMLQNFQDEFGSSETKPWS